MDDPRRLRSTALWQQTRRYVRDLHPICQHCGRNPSEEVDHIIELAKRPDLAFDVSNLQALCTPCHQAKSAGKVGCDEDGIPHGGWPHERGNQTTDYT